MAVHVKDIVPEEVKTIERELQIKTGIECPLYGYHGKSHKTSRSKQCEYYDCRTSDQLRSAMDSNLRHMYPAIYDANEAVYCKEIIDN